MPKISVIIPVYNSRNTVEECIYSILQQNFEDFEILLIDDGSTDGSTDLCYRLAKEDERIRFFCRENAGLSVARNFGINNASSDYICFADSDDTLCDGALEFMYQKAVSAGCDIVLCGYYAQRGRGYKKVFCGDMLLSTQEDIQNNLAQLKSDCLIDPVWNKLYKTEFVKNSGVLMPEGEILEDTYFNLSLLQFSPCISVCKECFYCYCFHYGSITRSYDPRKLPTVQKRAQLLSRVLKSDSQFCDYYYIRVLFSAFSDMFLSLGKNEILSEIDRVISTDTFKQAAANADFSRLSARAIIGIAQSGNRSLIYLLCRVYSILKYKKI